MDENDEKIEELINQCTTENLKDIESAKEIHSNFEVINEILQPLNETEIFFENPGLKINKTIRNKLQIIIPMNKITNNEDLNVLRDIQFFQKCYEENALEGNKTIENIKKCFIDLSQSVKSLIDLIEKVQSEYFKTIQQMVNPIIINIKNMEKFDKKKFGKDSLKIFEQKENSLNKKIKSYDKNLASIIKDLKEVFKKIKANIKIYIELMNNLDQPINDMIEGIENTFNDFENKSQLFFDIIINKPEEKNKAFEIFDEIKKLNTVTLNIIRDFQTYLYNNETNFKTKKTECSNDFNEIIASNNESSKKLNNVLHEAREVQGELNELLEFCSLPKIKEQIKEYKGLQIEEIKEKVIEGTDNIIQANKKIEVDTNKLKKYIKEKEEVINELISLDLVFVMDITGSMEKYLNFAKNKILQIIQLITSNSTMQVNLGFVGYRDYLDTKLDYLIYPELTNEIEKLKNFISLAKVGGGGNCEDMGGGLQRALNYEWKGRSRFALLIADVPCHGVQYHEVQDFDSFPQGDPKYNIIEIIKGYAKKNINLFCLNLTQLTIKLYNNFVDYYTQGKKSNNTADIYIGYLDNDTEKLANIIINNAKKFYEKRHETEPGF